MRKYNPVFLNNFVIQNNDTQMELARVTPFNLKLMKDYNNKTPYMCAAELGRVKFLEQLTEIESRKGPNEKLIKFDATLLNEQDSLGRDALMYAVINNKLDAVDLLLFFGPDIKQKDKKGRTALMYAAMYGRYDILKALLDAGAEKAIHYRDKSAKTALMYASTYGDNNCLSLLVEKGASLIRETLESVFFLGLSIALIVICFNPIGLSGIYLLLTQGIATTLNIIILGLQAHRLRNSLRYRKERNTIQDLNKYRALNNCYSSTELIDAIKAGKDLTTNSLLMGDINLNETDGLRKTALMWAIEMGNDELAKKLLTAGAKTYLLDKNNFSALSYAAMYGCKKIVAELLKLEKQDMESLKGSPFIRRIAGVLKWMRELYMPSPVFLATKYSDKDVIGQLLEAKYPIKFGALEIAAFQGNDDVIKFLAEKGAKIEPYSLGLVIENCKPTTLDYLMARGAKVTKKVTGRNYSPLQYAAVHGKDVHLQFMIDRGVNLNGISLDDASTALMYAVLEGNNSTAILLKQNGANNNKAHRFSALMLSLASATGYFSILQLAMLWTTVITFPVLWALGGVAIALVATLIFSWHAVNSITQLARYRTKARKIEGLNVNKKGLEFADKHEESKLEPLEEKDIKLRVQNMPFMRVPKNINTKNNVDKEAHKSRLI